MRRAKFLLLMCLVILLPQLAYAERIYVSRLSDKNLFINQSNTGTYSSSNCGPTSLAMIFNYLDYDYHSVNYLRNRIRPDSGWVYANEIEDYLDQTVVEYDIEYIYSEQSLIDFINDKQILLLCINASYINYDYASKWIGRTYTNVTGHFLVVTGYYQDDKQLFFEALDPLNNNVRYYKGDELIKAITNWWSCTFVFKLNE